MRMIDADELVTNILNWQAELKDDKAKELLTEVVHCINAKRTVCDIQKLIDGLQANILDYGSMGRDYARDAVTYNGAISDAMTEVKYAINPDYVADFTWEKGKEKDFLEEDNEEEMELS
jgi:hypothetical protein